MATVVAMRFSILDRGAAGRLDGIAEHAQHVERLGFRRFFLAEHHGVPGIPAGQPGMLASHVAARTQRIRVGTAGIMVLNHPPFLVAEQINLLEALYPGRIDIGLGSSVGFTAPVRKALRQGDPLELKPQFENEVEALLRYLRGEAAVTVRPEYAGTPIYILAGFRSVRVAARLGLGVILGGPVEMQEKAARLYREHALADAPPIISSLNIAVADTADQARDLLLPESYAKVMAQSTGEFAPLRPARELDLEGLTSQQQRRIDESLGHDVWGTVGEVGEELRGIGKQLGVDEFLITGDMPDLAGRARSEEMVVEI
ncbi:MULTISPECIES: MsnO8 family LLM class oxidoreductase [unclassified Corynebacterium]|jgi:luciferase family oxidoreductase, group 1|uniref:MsnO8 family LLM class oxidoreductase n=3 Tax=Corynebacterium TaxID=1716 RepID=UPI00351D0447